MRRSLLFLCMVFSPRTFAVPDNVHGTLIHRAVSFTNTSTTTSQPLTSSTTSSSILAEFITTDIKDGTSKTLSTPSTILTSSSSSTSTAASLSSSSAGSSSSSGTTSPLISSSSGTASPLISSSSPSLLSTGTSTSSTSSQSSSLSSSSRSSSSSPSPSSSESSLTASSTSTTAGDPKALVQTSQSSNSTVSSATQTAPASTSPSASSTGKDTAMQNVGANSTTQAQGTQVSPEKVKESSTSTINVSDSPKGSSNSSTSLSNAAASSIALEVVQSPALGASNNTIGSGKSTPSSSEPSSNIDPAATAPPTGKGSNGTVSNNGLATSAAATSEQRLTAQNFVTGSLNDTIAAPTPSRTGSGTGNSLSPFASMTNSSALPLTTPIRKFQNNSFAMNNYGGLDYLNLPSNLLVSVAPNLTSSFAPVITGVPDFDLSILDPGIVAAIFKLNNSQALSWDNIPWAQLQETKNGTFYFGLPLPNNGSYEVMSYQIQYNSASSGSNATHPSTAIPTGGPPPPSYVPPFGNGTYSNNTGPPGGGAGGGPTTTSATETRTGEGGESSAAPLPTPPASQKSTVEPPPAQPTNQPGNQGSPLANFMCSGTYTSFETSAPAPGQEVVTDTYTIPVTGTAPNYCASVVYAFRPVPTKSPLAAAASTTGGNAGTVYHQQSIVPSYVNSAPLNYKIQAPHSSPEAQNTPAPSNNSPGNTQNTRPKNKNNPPAEQPDIPSPKPSEAKPKSQGGTPETHPSDTPANNLLNIIPILNAGGSSGKPGSNQGGSSATPNLGAIIASAFGVNPPKETSKGSATPSKPASGGGKNPSPTGALAPSGSSGSIGEIIANAFGESGQPTQGSGGSKGGSSGSTPTGFPGSNPKPTAGTINGVTYTLRPDSITLNGQEYPTNQPQVVTMPNGQTVTIGPQAVSIGNSVIPVPGQPFSSGPPTSGKVNGVTFSVQSNAVTLNGQTFSPSVPQTLTLPGGQVVAIGPEGVDIGGTFVPIPGSSNSASGSSQSGTNPSDNSAPSGITNSQPSNLKPSGVINGVSYSISNAGVIIGGQTLSPSTPTTIALPGGHTAEIGPGGLSVDNVFVPMDSGNTPYSGAPSSGIIGGVPYSFTANGIIVNGQTYSISHPTTVNLAGGSTLQIQPGGEIKINNVPVPLPGSGDAGSPPSGTTSGVGYTFSPGSIQVDGQTYSLRQPLTTTLPNGQSLVISQGGSVQIGGVTIPNTNVPTGSKPQTGVINGVAYSIQPGSIVIQGKSYSLATPTTTTLPSGQTLSIKSDGTVQINGQSVNNLNPQNYGNIHGVSYSLTPSGTIIVGGTTISAATPTTIALPNGHIVEVAPDGEIAIDNIPISEPQDFVSAIAAAPTAVTAGGAIFSVGKSLVIIDGTTFTETPGANPTTFVKNGHTFSVGPSGVVVDHTTVSLRGITLGATAKATKHSSTPSSTTTSTPKSTSNPSVTAEAVAPTSSRKGAAAGGRAVGEKEKFLLGFAAGLASLGFLLL